MTMRSKLSGMGIPNRSAAERGRHRTRGRGTCVASEGGTTPPFPRWSGPGKVVAKHGGNNTMRVSGGVLAGRRAALALGAAGVLAAPALAQGKFPDRPIRLIIPWPPGGSADAQLRSMAEIAGKALGQTVVVENRPGASGTLGAQFLTTQARPDGYTLSQMHLSIIRRPYIVRNPPWDAVRDFSHIIGLCGWMYGIAVKADGPIKAWADYLAYARANPGRLTYTTSGIATTNHLTMEEIAAREKIELVHVPYRASNEAAVAVASGEVMSRSEERRVGKECRSRWSPYH